MSTPTRFVHDLIGQPPVTGATAAKLKDVEAVCCVCGQTESRTAPADRALGANFTDRSMFHAPQADRVCWACAAVCSGKPPATLRMWTVVAAPDRALPPSAEKAAAWIGQHDGVCLTSKADTTPLIDVLLDPPSGEWLVSVAESGQKHVVPYATVNVGSSGTIRMETLDIPYTREDWQHVFMHALVLRRLGIPAADVLAGTPRYLKTRTDLEVWLQHSDRLAVWVNSGLLRLALWAITKKVIENDNYPNA
ncbi:MAG: hypothetical protein KAZ70_01790 [Actinomyces sp.]|nr:hypothetical protein [Actinomyces sp.]